MIDLDDRTALERVDRSDMRSALVGFPDQVAEAWERSAELPPMASIDGIVVCGMGGSAIGGDFLATLLERWGCELSVTTVRHYELPPWANERTLVVATSYSGNTEETLGCARRALERDCPLLAVTSNGELAELARERRRSSIVVPSGRQPRAALGDLLMPVLRSLAPQLSVDLHAEADEAQRVVARLVERCDTAPHEENPAKAIARWLHGHVPVVYGSAANTDVAARRWKTQINENAKSPAYFDTCPEMNHNEVMGWEHETLLAGFRYVLLRDREEHPQIARRFEVSRELLEARGGAVREAWSEGEGELARLMSLVVLGDWVSFYLAMLYDVDPSPVGLIEQLKERLVQAS